MITVVICENCKRNFGIQSGDVRNGFVVLTNAVQCPHCKTIHQPTAALDIAKPRTGGVNITGAGNIYGDVVGRDKHGH